MTGTGVGLRSSGQAPIPRFLRAAALGVHALAALAGTPAEAKFHIVAHRGGTVARPENTLVGFQHAIDIGVHWSETDSWLSKDGVPILHHDIDLCRTTNIEDYGYDCTPGNEANNPLGRLPWVRDFTVAELKLLDVGSWFSPLYAGLQMPTLAEALQLVEGSGMPLLVEMKVPGQALKIRDILIDYEIPAENLVVWARAGEGIASEFRTHLPEPRRIIGLMDPRTISEANLAYWASQGDFGICVQSPWLTQQFVDLAHSYGLVLYTVPAPTSWMPTLQQVDIGVDYFHTGDSVGGVALAASLHCADGLDNDGDGLADFPDDPACPRRSHTSEVGQCQDGIDNDGDGKIDFPEDGGCGSLADAFEGADCDDGLDNDGDGLVDLADPGCLNKLATSRENPACNDGADNDLDGLVDFPADPECFAAWMTTEGPTAPPACGLIGIEPLALAALALRRRRRAAP